MNATDIIRATGFPNYRAARMSLKTDLNIRAWECHLQDYPDKLLIKYFKSGFPFSIRNSPKITNSKVHNHTSAIHFLVAAEEYLTTESSLGVQ